MHAGEHVIRSQKMCGTANNAQFPDCTAIVDNQENYDNFADYVVNLQLSPHGTVHVFTGGAFGECSDTYLDLKTSLSNYTLWNKIMLKLSDIEKKLWQEGHQTCPDPGSCAGLGQDSCTCYCSDYNSSWYDLGWNEVVNSHLWKGYKDMIPITDYEESVLEAWQMVKILDAVCNTDILYGDMACSESPLDILFFSTHSEVERIFQRKMLSGTMTDMEWPSSHDMDDECPGQKPEWKNLWFDYEFDQSDTDSADLTNEEFLHLLDPTSPEHVENMNYVYSSFNWTHCENYYDKEGAGYTSNYISTMESGDWVWNAEMDFTKPAF